MDEWKEGRVLQCVTHICACVCVSVRVRVSYIDLTLLGCQLEMGLRRSACNGDVIVFRCFLLPFFTVPLSSVHTHTRASNKRPAVQADTLYFTVTQRWTCTVCALTFLTNKRNSGCHFFPLIQHLQKSRLFLNIYAAVASARIYSQCHNRTPRHVTQLLKIVFGSYLAPVGCRHFGSCWTYRA